MQNVYNDAYETALRAAALIAERVRDAKTQLGKHDAADAAEEIRARIQACLDSVCSEARAHVQRAELARCFC